MSEMKRRSLQIAEEITNCATHGVGLGLSIAALAALIVAAARHGGASVVTSCVVFGVSLVVLYAASTLYHGARGPRLKQFFHTLDHAAIYILIAGTYTPFMLISLRGWTGWTLLSIVWGMALVGVCFKFFSKPDRFKFLSLSFYLVMGWLVVVAIKPMLATVPTGGLIWLLCGGLAYTFGVVFYVWKRLPYNHAVWHLFVLMGSACHFLSVYLYVLPRAA
jgi:hemolysin III